jgi:hypothetical protein
MAIALVQSVGANNAATTAHVTGTLGAAPTANNLLVILQYINTPKANVTAEASGFTVNIDDDDNAGAFCVRVTDKIAGGGEPTSYTTTTSTSVQDRSILAEFSGVDTATPRQTPGGTAGNDPVGSALSVAVGSITPAAAGTLLIAMAGFASTAGASGTEAIDTGYTLLPIGLQRLIAGYLVSPDALAKNPTISWPNSVGVDALHVAYKAAPAAAGQPTIKRYTNIPHSIARQASSGGF